MSRPLNSQMFLFLESMSCAITHAHGQSTKLPNQSQFAVCNRVTSRINLNLQLSTSGRIQVDSDCRDGHSQLGNCRGINLSNALCSKTLGMEGQLKIS